MANIPEKHMASDLIKAVILTTVIVSVLGYIDYITGEISIDILYILCLCLVTWFTNTFIGILCVIEIIFVRTTANYYDQIKIGSSIYELDTINVLFMFIYIIACVSVGYLKKILTDQKI